MQGGRFHLVCAYSSWEQDQSDSNCYMSGQEGGSAQFPAMEILFFFFKLSDKTEIS